MNKQIYISADYANDDGDKEVVDMLNNWGRDNLHSINFIDMSKVASGSVSKNSDCRPCDLKAEFNRQINASSLVIFVVGNKTGARTAGNSCTRADKSKFLYSCTPYKQNANGSKFCTKISAPYYGYENNVDEVNSYSYLRHEFEQAKKRNKPIIIVYNSTRYESNWLPSYMKGYENNAFPFWTIDFYGRKIGNYPRLKRGIENA